MSKLSVMVPDDLEERLNKYIPWGSKGAVIVELLYQLAWDAEKSKGERVYDLIRAAVKRNSEEAI